MISFASPTNLASCSKLFSLSLKLCFALRLAKKPHKVVPKDFLLNFLKTRRLNSLKFKQKQFLNSQIAKSFVFAFMLLLNASMVYSFEMPTQKVETQTTQNAIAEQENDGEGIYKFLKSKPDPNLLPMMFDLKDGYILKLKKVDYSTGEIIVDFFKENSIELVGTYNFIHNKIKLEGMPTETEIINSLQQIKTQLLERDQYSEYRKIQRNDHDVNFAEFILACLLFDDEKVNIKRSVLENKIILNSSYQSSFNLDTFDDKILLFYLKIFANIDKYLNDINSYIFFLILPFSITLLFFKKAMTTIGGKHNPHNYWEISIYSVSIMIFFYLVASEIKITDNSKISRTNFQMYAKPVIEKTVEIANKITEVFGETYLEVQRKNSGLLSKEEVERVSIEQLSIDKQLVQYSSILSRCKDAVDNIIFKEDGYSYRVKEGVSKISVLKPEFRRHWISLDLCDFAEQRVKFLQDRKVENERILTSYNESLNNKLNQNQLLQLANMQVKNIEDYGFFALPLIASNNMFIENLDMFNTNVKSQAQIEEARKEYNTKEGMKKGVIADSAVSDIIETLPYLMLPGAGTVASALNSTVGSATSSLEKIPVLGKLISTGKQAVAYGTTIYLYSYVVKYLPLAVLVMASILVMAWWLLSLIVYMSISQFVVVWVFTVYGEDAARKFLARGLIVVTRPITLAISIILCIIFLDLLASISDLLIDEQFINFWSITMEQEKFSAVFLSSDFGLAFMKGIFTIGFMVIGIFLGFYVPFHGMDLMLKMLGVGEDISGDAQGVIGKEVDNRSGQYSRPMVS